MSVLKFYELPVRHEEPAEEVLRSLQSDDKRISPKYFYDERGSQLFTEITQQPEYYLTRTEIGLLQQHAGALSQMIGHDCVLVEYGSGSSEKIRILLENLRPRAYAPLDISRDYLVDAARTLAEEFPWLEIHATCLDYTGQFRLPFDIDARHVAFFPGSSIGNFARTEAAEFLMRIRGQVGDGGGLLIGVDLKKDAGVLNAAYNDARGVTEQFNLNVLNHLNERFDGNFDLNSFSHFAEYEVDNGCIAMYLTSVRDQNVNLGGLNLSFSEGERIHTENSHKYGREEFLEMAQKAGFGEHEFWTDEAGWFGLFYLH